MLTITLIRHGRTEGNRRGAYVGRTDEPLSESGRAAVLARAKTRPEADEVYSSPMLRCLETAGLFYPDRAPILIERLREYDFGVFEGRTFEQIQHEPGIQEWVDSRGLAPFPGGENWADFNRRCVEGFLDAAGQSLERGHKNITIFAHGGVIVSIMAHLFNETENPFRFHINNAEGYTVCADPQSLRQVRGIRFTRWPEGACAADVVLSRVDKERETTA